MGTVTIALIFSTILCTTAVFCFVCVCFPETQSYSQIPSSAAADLIVPPDVEELYLKTLLQSV